MYYYITVLWIRDPINKVSYKIDNKVNNICVFGNII